LANSSPEKDDGCAKSLQPTTESNFQKPDLNPYLLDFLEKYPGSLDFIRNHPNSQKFLQRARSTKEFVPSKAYLKEHLSSEELKKLETLSKTGARGYQYLNGNLRGDRSCVECDQLVSVLNKLPNFEGVIFRGTDLPDDATLKNFLTEGNIVSDKGFLSSSREQPHPVSTPDYGVWMVINSLTGKSIENASSMEWEREVVFRPSTQFEVIMVQHRDNVWPIIYLNEVLPP